jgi:hypothetical protein
LPPRCNRQQRKDRVCGFDWQDSYEILHDGCVLCRLRIEVDGQWIERADVGSPSDQKDAGDKMKAAVSDSLKRAARKFGVGLYLTRIGVQWAEFDSQRKQFVKKPTLAA